ncbi:hypothetical protein GQ457_01G022580 [Hibiscus cannabinus]
MIRECTKVVDVGSIYTHQLAQEKLNNGRKALYADSVQAMHEKPLESKRFAVKEKDFHQQMYKSKLFTAKKNESRRRSMNKDFWLHFMIDYNEKLDTRRFLSERLRNIVKDETLLEGEAKKNVRHVSLEMSRATGKLLNMYKKCKSDLSGMEMMTKHGGNITASVDIRRRKKEKFNLKEKIHNIKYSSTFRRRLFDKKIQSMIESYSVDDDLAKDILSGPTIMLNFGKSHENPTEVLLARHRFATVLMKNFGGRWIIAVQYQHMM